MTYDTTSPPVRVIDIVSREPEPQPQPEPVAAAAAPPRPLIAVHPLALLGCPPYVHPLALLGWPAHAVPGPGRLRPGRRPVLRGRKGER